jgi:GxxExxY protein
VKVIRGWKDTTLMAAKEYDPSAVSSSGLLFPEESFQIKACCLKVHNELGCGFLEKVYENALAHELKKCGLWVRQQAQIDVAYDGIIVGQYVADIVVNDLMIIEIKATEVDHPMFQAQVIHYLKATGMQLGFLVNFGMKSLKFARQVFTKHCEKEP